VVKKAGVDRTLVTKALSGAEPLTKSIIAALKLRVAFAADDNKGHEPTVRSLLDAQDVVPLLRSGVEQAGGRNPWSRKTGVDPTTVSKVASNKRRPNESIIAALKLRKVFVPDDN
jgi:hypothetical protein